MVEEAHLQQTESGLVPSGPGWFVVNVADTAWGVHDAFGSGCIFENREDAPFPELGINISAIQPDQPLCLYHEENAQEGFLVLAGECRLLVNGEERPLRAWDFFHCPAETEHVIVGAGSGPALILAVGARHDPERLRYPVSDAAARYGASTEQETPDPAQAYGRFPPPRDERPAYWGDLPWG